MTEEHAKENVPKLTTLMVHDIPKTVKEKFKAACAINGIPMHAVVIELIKVYTAKYITVVDDTDK